MEDVIDRKRKKPVALWLLVGVFLIIVQIILGGITRLTDSGLSITEWKPLLGTIPPVNDQQWMEAFDHYKQIAQYKALHSYFTLEDFKSIYFWEWLHRVWGRVIAVVFLIPFIIFLVQKRFSKEMLKPMVILFLLGGLQGLIGWVMVKSGLNEENLYVSHIRLAIHFIMALGLLVYTFWFALLLLVKPAQLTGARTTGKYVSILIALLTIQLVYGAFMAGLKAAPSAPTWPDINGAYIPANMTQYAGRTYAFLPSIINNPITVHFIHRNMAYLIVILILALQFFRLRRSSNQLLNRIKWLPLFFVVLQVVLGIISVLVSPRKVPQHWGPFEWAAQLHQVVAILLLLSLVAILFLNSKKESYSIQNDIDPHLI